MPFHTLQFEDAALERRAQPALRRLPALCGEPIRVHNADGLRDARGPVHGGAYLRERRMAFNCSRQEFPRIFVHELAHFAWLRLGNPARRSWEGLLRAERSAGARGELGWSAEWRKQKLSAAQVRRRHRRWREYCCESFCDTAAWLYSGVRRHPEFTLAQHFRQYRRTWFTKTVAAKRLSI
ncbi:MAG TPA: hypothetical protein VNY05_18770 [Candidatus Acidoferrales bacterium]|nr:hypothetical protein [Candidatus Acidoferrales bacterium]